MITFLLHLLMYLISVYYVITYFHIAYSTKGIWYHLKMKPVEYILAFIPAVNTAFAIYFWVTENPTREEFRLQDKKVNGQHHIHLHL